MLLEQSATQAPPSLLSYVILWLGLAMMAFFLLRIVFRHASKRKAAERSEGYFADARRVVASDSPEVTRAASSLLHAPERVQQWQVELHDTARELKAELDSKLILLQHLVAQARVEGDRLEKLLEQSQSKE